VLAEPGEHLRHPREEPLLVIARLSQGRTASAGEKVPSAIGVDRGQLGPIWLVDVVVVLGQIGMPLVGLAADEPVEPVVPLSGGMWEL
jgi:hypothetical protein